MDKYKQLLHDLIQCSSHKCESCSFAEHGAECSSILAENAYSCIQALMTEIRTCDHCEYHSGIKTTICASCDYHSLWKLKTRL